MVSCFAGVMSKFKKAQKVVDEVMQTLSDLQEAKNPETNEEVAESGKQLDL
jgi:hypothetical protein